MKPIKKSNNLEFLGSGVGGVFWFLLIPVFSMFFLNLCLGKLDRESDKWVIGEINAVKEMPEDIKASAKRYYSKVKMSQLVEGSEKPYDFFPIAAGENLKYDYWTLSVGFKTAKFLLYLCAGFFLFSFLYLGYFYQKKSISYAWIVFHWSLSKAFCVLQILGQAGLVMFLSFWITVYFTNIYYPQMIFIVGLISLIPVFLLLDAMFRRPPLVNEYDCSPLSREIAPKLWERLEEIAQKANSPMPDQILVGFDHNFFVTECSMDANGVKFKGRTLYLSLPLLGVLTKKQAESVFAHELGHFQAGDTRGLEKIAFLFAEYRHYLKTMEFGPVHDLLNVHWLVIQAITNSESREKEYRADRLAAQLTSPMDFATGLVTVSLYSHFQDQLEQSLFSKEKELKNLNLPEMIRQGFWKYLEAVLPTLDVDAMMVSHPFDTHPTNHERFEALGLNGFPKYGSDFTEVATEDTWIPLISNSFELEQKHWSKYQKDFKEAHDTSLAYRFLPITDEEREAVEKEFPKVTLQGKSEHPLVITCDSIWPPHLSEEILFEEIARVFSGSEFGIPYISLQMRDRLDNMETVKLQGYSLKPGDIVKIVSDYFNRYETARNYYKTKKEASSNTHDESAREKVLDEPNPEEKQGT